MKTIKEGVVWRFVDHRLAPETSKDGRELLEYRKCPNGHNMFISAYKGFTEGKEETIACPECGTVAFEWKPFWVREECEPLSEKGNN